MSDRLTDDERAELYAPDRRMSAYYFDFDPTGIPAVDAILSAVAVAGKSAHHTDQWTEDECDGGWCPRWGDGRSLVDVIQAAANEAAIEVRRLRGQRAEALALATAQCAAEERENHSPTVWATDIRDALEAGDE